MVKYFIKLDDNILIYIINIIKLYFYIYIIKGKFLKYLINILIYIKTNILLIGYKSILI